MPCRYRRRVGTVRGDKEVQMRVRELMTSDVITVGPDTPLKEAARRMLEAGVSGLPVTDEGKLVGIITEADFVAGEADRRSRRAGLLRFLDRRHEIPSQERSVRDVMTSPVVTIGPEADHAEAARVMEKNQVKRLPVVENDEIVGLLSRSDALRAFIRSDKDIIDEIKEYLMAKVLWIEPGKIEVGCTEGNVTLRGRLDTRSDANLLVELTSRLDGVASVKDELSWEFDNTRIDVATPYGAGPRTNW
jgi:CBS domain-containing protein